MSRVGLLIGLSMLATTLCGADDSYDPEKLWAAREAENARLLSRLDALEPTRFFRLDGGPKKGPSGPAGSFHDTPVLAAGVPSDPAAARDFKASLRRVLATSDGSQSACFFPRHGVTLSDGQQQYDIVLCFECSAFLVYGTDGKVIYRSGFDADDEAARWDAAFAAAGLVSTAQ